MHVPQKQNSASLIHLWRRRHVVGERASLPKLVRFLIDLFSRELWLPKSLKSCRHWEISYIRPGIAQRARAVPCKQGASCAHYHPLPADPCPHESYPHITLRAHRLLALDFLRPITGKAASPGMATEASAVLLVYSSVLSFGDPFLNSVTWLVDTYCYCYYWLILYQFLISP